MPRSFAITHVESTSTFTLYHLDAPKAGATAIVVHRRGPSELEPTLATLAQHGLRFDFEIEPEPPPSPTDPRLRTACRIRAVTLCSRGS